MRAVSFILFATISLQGLAQDGARTFELNTPLPSPEPGMVATSLPENGKAPAPATAAGPIAAPVSPLIAGLPPIPASVTPSPPSTVAVPASVSASAPALPPAEAGAGQPVKSYATLAQAASAGVNPLAVPKPAAVKPPVETSQLDTALAWARNHPKEVGLGLLLVLLLAVGQALWRRRSH